MSKISIVTNCWNEVENIPVFYARCMAELKKHPEYDYEFVVEDNLSTDGTREVLRELAAKDPKFKVILNANNFGHIRSPFNALLNMSGDLVFYLCSDLQEPPEMLSEFLKKYEEGYKVVCGVRSGTKANRFMEFLRGVYYHLLRKFADNQEVVQKFTGFGLYARNFAVFDQQFVDKELFNIQIFRLFTGFLHRELIEFLVCLCAQSMDSRAFARVEHAELNAGLIGIDAHFPA